MDTLVSERGHLYLLYQSLFRDGPEVLLQSIEKAARELLQSEHLEDTVESLPETASLEAHQAAVTLSRIRCIRKAISDGDSNAAASFGILLGISSYGMIERDTRELAKRGKRFSPASREISPDRAKLIEEAKECRAEGMSYEQIGRKIGRSKGTVQRWLNR